MQRTKNVAAWSICGLALVATSPALAQTEWLEFRVQGEITTATNSHLLAAPFTNIAVGDTYRGRYRYWANWTRGTGNPNSSIWINNMLSVEFAINEGDWEPVALDLSSIVSSSIGVSAHDEYDSLIFWFRAAAGPSLAGKFVIRMEGPPQSVFDSLPMNSSELAGLRVSDLAQISFFGSINDVNARMTATLFDFESLIAPAPGSAAIVTIGALAVTRRRQR